MANLKIKALRRKKKMTQKDLGKLINLSSSAIGMYEQGRRIPDIDTLIKISIALDVSLNDIVDLKE